MFSVNFSMIFYFLKHFVAYTEFLYFIMLRINLQSVAVMLICVVDNICHNFVAVNLCTYKASSVTVISNCRYSLT